MGNMMKITRAVLQDSPHPAIPHLESSSPALACCPTKTQPCLAGTCWTSTGPGSQAAGMFGWLWACGTLAQP